MNSIIKKDSIYEALKEKLVSRSYPPGYKFPSEPVLAKELGVGRITLRSALGKLEKAGLVFRSPGKGTFASSGLEKNKTTKKFLLLINDDVGRIEFPATYINPVFDRYCERRDISTEMMSIDVIRSLSEEKAIDTFGEADYDGVLICVSNYTGNEKEIKILRSIGKPVLIPHAKPNDNVTTGFATMMSDYKKGLADAARYLISIGHKNILTIGALNDANEKNIREFKESEYLEFLKMEGANPDPELLVFVPYKFSGMTKIITNAMKRSKKPTAILCFSDFFAMNVYESLNELCIRVPDDISVMGYCGYPGGHMMNPPLSTIDLGYSDIAKTSVELLDNAKDWFGEGKQVPCVISPHKLIVRESTAKI